MRFLLIGALAVLAVAPLSAADTSTPASAQLRVAVCHLTTSRTQPYRRIVVTTSAALRLHQRDAADIIPAPARCPRSRLTPTSGGTAIRTDLLGVVERPEPGDPDGQGQATIRLRRGQGQVCFRLSAEDIALPAVGAHIHRGNANVAGPVVVGLSNPNASGVSSGCVAVSRTLVGQILSSRASFYVNVHTSQFPDGAIRGQLGPTEGVRFFVVDLRGANEVPPADPDGTGMSGVRMREGQREVCFTVAVQNIMLPSIGAHIHRGSRGENGPIVIPFETPVQGTSAGCVTADSVALVREIMDNPDGFYVNVHNAQFPGGAVRGQLD
jgi:hypothetical protein